MNLEDVLDQEKNQLTSTSSFTKISPLPRPYSILQGKKIHMYDLCMAH